MQETEEKLALKRWKALAEKVKQGDFRSKSNEKPLITKFSWTNIPLGKICPLKSNDISKFLISENDKLSSKSSAASFMNHFQLSDIQELLVTSSSHWQLTPHDPKLTTKPLTGLIEMMDLPWDADKIIVLFPQEKNNDPNSILKVQEIHQILRELVVGIFVFNQLPCISLSDAPDSSTICHIPPAYKDTMVGQALIEVDYMLKSLWRGSFMAKSLRTKFLETWKKQNDENGEIEKLQINDFLRAGLQDVCDVSGYELIYDEIDYNRGNRVIHSQNKYRMNLNMEISSWFQLKTMFLLNVDYLVNFTSPFDVNKDDKLHLRNITRVINKNMTNNQEILVAIEKLKIIASLLPILIALKKRRKIPNIAYLRTPIPRKLCATETEFPPSALGPKFKGSDFYGDGELFSLDGGVHFDIETSAMNPDAFPKELLQCFRKRLMVYDNEIDGKPAETRGPTSDQPLMSFIFNEKRYYGLEIRLENCLPKSCQKPLWTSSIYTELTFYKFKTLPKTMTQIEEQIFYEFGIQSETWKQMKLKQRLHVVASRGLSASFHALFRDVHANGLTEAFDEAQGWSFLHTAAKSNSVSIITQLYVVGMDINVQSIAGQRPGLSALHVAAEYGSIEVFSCLISLGADLTQVDSRGWAPIHTAAFFNQVAIVKIINRHCDQLTLLTINKLKSAPCHLSAMNGSLETLQWFLNNYQRKRIEPTIADTRGCNIVHLATLNSHVHILKYVITDRSEIDIWKIISEMLLSSIDEWRIEAVRCIRLLSEESFYLDKIVKADLHATLVGLLQDVAIIQPHVVATLSQMSGHLKVQQALRHTELLEVLVKLLSCGDEVTASQAAFIIGDVAVDQHSRNIIGNKGGIEDLGKLLENPSNLSLILSVLKAISSVCNCHEGNQNKVSAINNFAKLLVDLLQINNDELRCQTCATLVIIAKAHPDNQTSIIDTGGIEHIRRLLALRNPKLQKKSTELLRELVMNNPSNQARLLEMNVLQPTISMLKGSDVELKEVAADAIWAMAGSGVAQRKIVAQKIGTLSLINMLLTKSKILVCTSCPLVAAIVYESRVDQRQFITEGGLNPLIRMIQDSNCPSIVQIAIFKTLSTLALGVAYNGNTDVQNELEKQAVPQLLMSLINNSNTNDPIVKVEAINLLASASIRNKGIMETVFNQKFEFYKFVKEFLEYSEEEICLVAGMSLALFTIRAKDWSKLKKEMSFELEYFKKLLASKNQCHQCLAAFQLCVLSSIVSGYDRASCIVISVQHLFKLITISTTDEHEDVFILSASLIQCLCKVIGGFVNAIVSLEIISVLFSILMSRDTTNIRPFSASTLAVLSKYECGRMKMISICRRQKELYKSLNSNLPSTIKLCPKFMEKM